MRFYAASAISQIGLKLRHEFRPDDSERARLRTAITYVRTCMYVRTYAKWHKNGEQRRDVGKTHSFSVRFGALILQLFAMNSRRFISTTAARYLSNIFGCDKFKTWHTQETYKKIYRKAKDLLDTISLDKSRISTKKLTKQIDFIEFTYNDKDNLTEDETYNKTLELRKFSSHSAWTGDAGVPLYQSTSASRSSKLLQ